MSRVLFRAVALSVLMTGFCCGQEGKVGVAEEATPVEEKRWENLDNASLRLGVTLWSQEEKGGGARTDADETRFALQLNGWGGFDQAVMIGGMLSYDFTIGFGGDEDTRGAGTNLSTDIEGTSHTLDVGPCLPIRLRYVTLYPFVSYNFYAESLERSGGVLGGSSVDEDFSSHGLTLGARVAAKLGIVGFELIGRYSMLLDATIDVGGSGISAPEFETEGKMIRIEGAVWIYVSPDTMSISVSGGVNYREIDKSDREQIGTIVFQTARREALEGTVKLGFHLFF